MCLLLSVLLVTTVPSPEMDPLLDLEEEVAFLESVEEIPTQEIVIDDSPEED